MRSPLHISRKALTGLIVAALCVVIAAFGGEGVLQNIQSGNAHSNSAQTASQTTVQTESGNRGNAPTVTDTSTIPAAAIVTPDTIPEYTGEALVDIDGGIPAFTPEELAAETFESYAPLDSFGRAGQAFALVSDETTPAPGAKRGNISYIHPTGWRQKQYDFIQGGSLYNRSHLIAYSLADESDNENNLITGTTYMNQGAMQEIESRILAYIRNTGNHVLVRATPIYEGDDLVARGIQYEAFSIEDNGQTICENVFLFNVQPGVEIDYATGKNWESGTTAN